MQWTSDQKLAIESEGENIIVSAGAGSGKTAVLTERVIRKLKSGVNISRLLVLTFTEAAASEMKERIRKAISKNEDLKGQLDYIDAAYITTFDSYALSIVRKYHYLLNVSPKIQIIDSSVINIVKKEALDTIFEELYASGDENFLKLIGDFCDKDDLVIKKVILKINNALEMMVNKSEYLDTYLDTFYRDDYIVHLFDEYELFVLKKVEILKDLCECIRLYDNTYYEKLMKEMGELLECQSYEDVKNRMILKLPILRNGSEEVKNYKEMLNNELKELRSLVHDTREHHLSYIKSTKPYVMAIIDVIQRLDVIIDDYKFSNDVYEFVDISKMAIRVVRDHSDVCDELRNYYHEIMVDEYQDTNDLQEEFISLLDNHNVYMVGDVKQSIYRFRNANPAIFKNKYDSYGRRDGGLKIDLVKNFRSREEVLNGINKIFDLIMTQGLGGADYQVSHQMVYGNLSYSNEGKCLQNHSFELLNYSVEDTKFTKEEIEIFTIAKDIKDKIDNKYQVYDFGSNSTRNITYRDFCIIMDRNTAFDKYKKIFEYLQIPLCLYKDEVLTSKDDILLIKNLLSFVLKIKNGEFDQEFKYYFTSIARSYLSSMSDEELFDIFLYQRFKETKLFEIAKEISFSLDSLSSSLFLNQVISKFHLYESSMKVGNVRDFMVRVEYLQNLAVNLEGLGYTPEMFVSYLSEMIVSDDEIKYSVNTDQGNSVKMMNIHKSKGLEFPICYFSGLYKTFNVDDLKSRFLFDKKYGIITPYYRDGVGELITKTLYKESYLKEEVSEKIRLFYVALTRCKEKAILVGNFEKEVYELNDYVRLGYRSFLDMICSVKNYLLDYMKEVDLDSLGLTKNYHLVKKVNYEDVIAKTDDRIVHDEVVLSDEVISSKHFSKSMNKIVTKEEKSNMEYGLQVHELFEFADFKNTNNAIVKKFLLHDELSDIDDAKIYKEYEFMYEDNMTFYHGIIDLLLIYDGYVKIIDYKLKNIDDEHYVQQLMGYQRFIEKKTKKKVSTYLYSIMDDTFKKVG